MLYEDEIVTPPAQRARGGASSVAINMLRADSVFYQRITAQFVQEYLDELEVPSPHSVKGSLFNESEEVGVKVRPSTRIQQDGAGSVSDLSDNLVTF